MKSSSSLFLFVFLVIAAVGGGAVALGAEPVTAGGPWPAAHAYPMVTPAPAQQSLPDPKSEMSVGWIIVATATTVGGIGVLLAFLRRESRMQEPPQEQKVSGGPITIKAEEVYVEKEDHAELKVNFVTFKTEIWQVVNGLRMSVSKIQSDISALRAQREANGERLNELTTDIKDMSKLVHQLSGIVQVKLEAKHK